MIRVGFPPLGGENWLGGYNYLLNLMRGLAAHAAARVQPVAIFAAEADAATTAPFEVIPGVEVRRSPVFDAGRQSRRLARAILTGVDSEALAVFREAAVDVVFEPAQFFGWRFPLPAIAWFPDFQHRHLRQLFDARAYWKREIGFQAQLRSGRRVMVSSADAAADCARFYPVAAERIEIVRFAVPQANNDYAAARAVADRHGLPETFFFLPNQFWVHKNHGVVVDALELLRARGAQVVVAMTGREHDPRDPGHVPRLRQRIVEAGLVEQVRLLGLVPASDLPGLMRSCTALINPSRFEGWSTTVEEAKAMGTPMLLSDIAVHREQAGNAATYFAPHDAAALAAALSTECQAGASERAADVMHAKQAALARLVSFTDSFASAVERSAIIWHGQNCDRLPNV